MHKLKEYPTEFEQQLPSIDTNSNTKIYSDILVQIVDFLDIGSSISVQLEKLIAEKQNIVMANEDEHVESHTKTMGNVLKYTVRDSSDNLRHLIFHNSPSPCEIVVGSFIIIKRGCEYRRGILIAEQDTVLILNKRENLSVEDRIEALQKILANMR